MGLLDLFFSKNPEKHEKKGDAFFQSGNWGVAKLAYEAALDALAPSAADYGAVASRLGDKLTRARESLAADHRQTAENLLEQDYVDDARDLLVLARELTDDTEQAAAIDKRLEEVEQWAVKTAWGEMDDAAPVSYTGGGTRSTEDEDEGEGENETFMALCGTLPEEVQAEYTAFGADFRAGYLALNRGEFALAAAHLSRAMDENPDPGSFVSLELATAYLNLEKYDDARRLLTGFLQHRPDALPGYQLLCDVFWETGQFEQAQALLAGCPDTFKASLAYHQLSGETMFRAGDIAGAIAFYRDFMATFGWNESIAKALAAAYEAAGDMENARDLYARIAAKCTGCRARVDPLVKRKLADLSFDLGQHTTPILEMYLSLAQEDPDRLAFYYERVSRIYSETGNEEEARRYRSFARQVRNND